MADLGDLSSFLKEGSVSDLDWLDVDEQAYRDLEKLPKQNLDYSPQLEAAWAHKDEAPSVYVENVGPRTMREVGERSYEHMKQAGATILRTARVHMMQDPNPRKVLGTLISKFGKDAVRSVKEDLTALFQERGLLGRYYLASSDFPGCHQAAKAEVAFARRFAADARFVTACDRCSGCVHNAGNTCAVFQKQIVVDVPYTAELANQVEQKQAGKGKAVQASAAAPKERIRLALLAEDVKVASAPEAPKPVVNPASFLRPVEATKKVHLPVLGSLREQAIQAGMAWAPTAEGKTASANAARDKVAVEVVSLLRKEMLRGRSEHELMQAMKLSFSLDDLRMTREHWEPLFKEAGLYGAVYSTQDSFDSCHEGADFLAKNASSVKGIVAGGKCQGCVYNKMARCLLYGRPLVAKADDLYTSEVLNQTVREHRLAGRIGQAAVAVEGDVRNTLKSVHRTASTRPSSASLQSHMKAFTGGSMSHTTGDLTKREIIKAASRYLNEGLYGTDLLAALKRNFDPRDLKAAQSELRSVLAEQGLQGIHYVDPTIYSDYGRGCDEGMRLHRARLVPYVKKGEKCASCVLQTSPGHCSKYAKQLVIEPPYSDKKAQQREMLASGKATEISLPDLMDNRSILAQFDMQGELAVDVKDTSSPVDVSVELGTGQVRL